MGLFLYVSALNVASNELLSGSLNRCSPAQRALEKLLMLCGGHRSDARPQRALEKNRVVAARRLDAGRRSRAAP
jgi:hypothetical protein